MSLHLCLPFGTDESEYLMALAGDPTIACDDTVLAMVRTLDSVHDFENVCEGERSAISVGTLAEGTLG